MPRSLKILDTPSQQLRHFTNRADELQAFHRLLELPEGRSLPVLMFYGIGGNGKSWLLRRLREVLPEGFPCALLDLEPLTGGTPYHADSSRALGELRRQLTEVPFPRFDLAYAWLRFREGVKKEPVLRGSGAAAWAVEAITEAAPTLAEGVPLLGWLLKQGARLFKKSIKDTPLEKWLGSQVGQEDFQDLRRADRQDLYGQLSGRFLQDAVQCLPQQPGKACRGVLFLDTFEALRVGVPAQAQAYYRETWVRGLHATESPLLLVLSGRDRLHWDEWEPAYCDPANLEQHLVGGLSVGDARDFLHKCGITDWKLLEAVLGVSLDLKATRNGAGSAYHPFSLGLCADTIHEETARGKTVDPATFDLPPGQIAQLAQRFLKSLSDPAQEIWVQRLALTPRFDEPAARAAFSAERGVSQDAAWHAFSRYSFVQSTDVPGWWALHARMREALAENHLTAPADDRFWIAYWRSRSELETDDFASLAWYHQFRLESAPARQDWKALAKRLRQARRMREHYALLGWWEPIGLLQVTVPTSDEGVSLNTLAVEYCEASLGHRGANLQQAIACYQAALRVRTETDFPQDWAMTQNNLGNAYTSLPTGDRGAKLQQAIACYQAALRVYTETDFAQDWAMTQNNLGNAYSNLSTGDRGANLQQAIDCCQAALRVYTETDFPQEWAVTQNNLGNAHSDLPTGDRGANLLQAIACYQASLRVRTETDFPQDWAMTQNNLGISYSDLPTGDRGANLLQAIACYQAALRVYTKTDFPQAWAVTQNNLGIAYMNLPTGDRGANLLQAIACYQAALRVYTKTDFPQDWAMTQNNLGNAYNDLPTGDRGANLQQAIDCYQAALCVYTKTDFPQAWAVTQHNQGAAYSDLPTGDRGANLQQAIACYQAALRVRTETDFPQAWAMTQNTLGNAYMNLPTGDRGANLQQAIDCYQAALRVYTETDFTQDWAGTQNNLGTAYSDLATGDRGANLQQAVACYQAALRVYTETDFTQDWAGTQNNLGIAYRNLPTGDRGANLQQAIACYQAALRVYTKTDFPQAWAVTQNNLGIAYMNLPTGGRGANLHQAIACYQAALRVYTETDFPQDWAMTQNNLGIAYNERGLPEQNHSDLEQALASFEAAERGYRRVGMIEASEECRRQAEEVRKLLE